MTGKKAITLTTTVLTLTMTVCGSSTAIAASELTAESKPATQYTIDANQEVYALLDFEDTTEFENATKGLLASPDTLDICDENGKVVWSQTAYAFLYPENTDARYLCADADVTWNTKRAGLLSVVQKNAENVAALIEQEGDETCLTRLMDAVTVTSEYKYMGDSGRCLCLYISAGAHGCD